MSKNNYSEGSIENDDTFDQSSISVDESNNPEGSMEKDDIWDQSTKSIDDSNHSKGSMEKEDTSARCTTNVNQDSKENTKKVDNSKLFNWIDNNKMPSIDFRPIVKKTIFNTSNLKINNWRRSISILPRTVNFKNLFVHPVIPLKTFQYPIVVDMPDMSERSENIFKIFDDVDDTSDPPLFMGEPLLTSLPIKNNNNFECDRWTVTKNNDMPMTNDNDTEFFEESSSDLSFLEEMREEDPMSTLERILNVPQKPKIVNTEWAEIVDTELATDFDVKLPNMAHKFQFELDVFQKLAILKLEERANVFVGAHTSAGKTAVAEYAIALAFKYGSRVVYTSPVKALSNQKYRDLSQIFEDVGLITGDIQINPTARCLVVTTEILRSMLHKKSDIINDLDFVVFDEIHYINDDERGYVWEEVIIMLPNYCQLVMLSATVPNIMEFANWIGRIKSSKVYVVTTKKRPVPLCHYLYTGYNYKSKNEKFLVMGKREVFSKKGHTEAVRALSKRSNTGTTDYRHFKLGDEKKIWRAIIEHLQQKKLLPAIGFILSKNRINSLADALKTVDLVTEVEKKRIKELVQVCLDQLNEYDKNLKQVNILSNLLTCGIGIHHSGILPMLREVVELLFQSGLVKLLFATETFAVGMNMPAKTVIFDSLNKYDGIETRTLRPSEYIQMAGRAGRRGLDLVGTVIILCKTGIPSKSELNDMILGSPTKLSSQFRMTYGTILHLLSDSRLAEDMMKKSFQENSVQSKTSIDEIESISKQIGELKKTANYDRISDFCDLAYEYISKLTNMISTILDYNQDLLYIGRIIMICFEEYAFQYAVFLGYKEFDYENLQVLVLQFDEPQLPFAIPQEITNKSLWFATMAMTIDSNHTVEYIYPKHKLISIKQKHIVGFTSHMCECDPQEIITDYETEKYWKTIKMNKSRTEIIKNLVEISNENSGIISLSKLIKNIYYDEMVETSDLEKLKDIKDKFMEMKDVTNIPTFQHEFNNTFMLKFLSRKHAELTKMISVKNTSLYERYKEKIGVLQDLGYLDSTENLTFKGKIANALGTNEIMLTEIIFSNVLKDLSSQEIAALLSCLVANDKLQINNKYVSSCEIDDQINTILGIKREIEKVERCYFIPPNDSITKTINTNLVKIIYDWLEGSQYHSNAFNKIQEGVLAYIIQKLYEMLLNVRDVLKMMGDPDLESQVDKAAVSLKTGIIFAPSLYTRNDIKQKFESYENL